MTKILGLAMASSLAGILGLLIGLSAGAALREAQYKQCLHEGIGIAGLCVYKSTQIYLPEELESKWMDYCLDTGVTNAAHDRTK